MKNLILVIACALTFSFFSHSYGQYQQSTGTQVYVNQVEISVEELTLLQQLIGSVPAGNYYLDGYGNFGVVGYYPTVNLVQVVAYYNALQQQATNQTYNNYNYFQNGGTYQQAPNSAGVYWQEGNASGYFNHNTDISVSSDGNTSVFSVGGEVLNLPPY